MPPEGLPLLEEANFSNLQVQVTDPTLKMDKSEKLQVFRATGSNFSQIDFASGVSLHTLYLPNSISRINLQQAKLLNNIITDYAFPQMVNGKYVADRGLYIEGLTDWKTGDAQTKVSYLNLDGQVMGFDSYKLLTLYYNARSKVQTDSQIKITDVQWTPYKKLVKGDAYDENAMKAGRYYIDNDHYGYTQLDDSYQVALNYDNDIANGVLYLLDADFNEDTYPIKDIDMLKAFIQSNYFIGTDGKTKVPELAGEMYVHNATAEAETYIRDTLNVEYPNLNITFKTVTKSNSMKFIVPDLEDGTNRYLGTYSYVPLRNGSKEKSVQKKSTLDFGNPYILYNPKEAKQNYDFLAWSSSLNVDDEDAYIGRDGWSDDDNNNAWKEYIAKIKKDAEDAEAAGETSEIDYTVYALFKKHNYISYFYNGDQEIAQAPVMYGECLQGNVPHLMPVHPQENELDTYKTYRFLGFSRNDKTMVVKKESEAQLVDFSMLFSVTDYKFYAVYIEADVHDKVSDLSLFSSTTSTWKDSGDSKYNITGCSLCPAEGKVLSGKLTLPKTFNGLPVVAVHGFASTRENPHEITHVFWEGGNNPNLRMIGTSAFQSNDKLEFFEFTTDLRYLSQDAFSGAMLKEDSLTLLGTSPIHTIAAGALSLYVRFPRMEILKLRGTIEEIDGRGIMFRPDTTIVPDQGYDDFRPFGLLQIGTQEEPSRLRRCGASGDPGIKASNSSYAHFFEKLNIYQKSGVFQDSNVFINNYGTRSDVIV
jgi:hypothetical protein